MASFVRLLLLGLISALSNPVASTLFRASGLNGFDVDIDIGATRTTVTAYIPNSQAFLWHGIGFGRSQMQGSYAIIETPGFPPSFSEIRLGNEALLGGILDATASNWNVSSIDSSGGTYVMTLSRANDVALNNQFYTFDDQDADLDIIYAIGSDSDPTAVDAGHTTRIVEVPPCITRVYLLCVYMSADPGAGDPFADFVSDGTALDGHA